MSDKRSTPSAANWPRHEQVADLLRTLIAEMRLRPGQRLVERELVELAGVSRSSVREAIRQLAAEGLVTTTPKRGAVVSLATPREAAEVYEIRAVLEGLAAELFVHRAREDQVLQLRRAYDEIEAEAQTREAVNSARLLEAKNRFYEVLLTGADNATMVGLLKPLQTRIAALRATSMSQPGRTEAALAEIRAIVEAVEARDADAAFGACVSHVYAAARSALEALARATPTTETNGDVTAVYETERGRIRKQAMGEGYERRSTLRPGTAGATRSARPGARGPLTRKRD